MKAFVDAFCKNISCRLFKCIHSYIFNPHMVTFWSFISTTFRLLYNVYIFALILVETITPFSQSLLLFTVLSIYNCDFESKLFLFLFS